MPADADVCTMFGQEITENQVRNFSIIIINIYFASLSACISVCTYILIILSIVKCIDL